MKIEFWVKGSAWIFLTHLCHYYMLKDIKTLFLHYEKLSQQYAEEKTHKMWRFKVFVRPWLLFCKISSEEVIKNILGLEFFHGPCTRNCIEKNCYSIFYVPGNVQTEFETAFAAQSFAKSYSYE